MLEPVIGPNFIDDKPPEERVKMLRSDGTIIVLPVNDDAGEDPSVEPVKTLKEAFDKYKPEISIPVKDADNNVSDHSVRPRNIKEMSLESVLKVVPELRDQAEILMVLQDLRKQFKSNVPLIKNTEDDKKRAQLLNALKSILALLEGGEPSQVGVPR